MFWLELSVEKYKLKSIFPGTDINTIVQSAVFNEFVSTGSEFFDNPPQQFPRII
jgi:hypothetical protein